MWEHTVSTWTDHVTYGCNSIVLVFDSPNNLFFFFFLLNFYVWPQGGIWFSLIHKTHLSPFKLESHICLSFWTLGTRIFSNGSISKGYCIPVGFYRSWTKSFLSVSQICIKACLWIFYLLITVLKILHSLGTFPICFFTLRPMVETWIILVCAYYMPHAIVFGNERVQRSLSLLRDLTCKMGLFQVHVWNNPEGKTLKANCLSWRPLWWVQSLDLWGKW